MDKKQALKILKDHQSWRLGSDEVTMGLPSDLTQALNIAIHNLENEDIKKITSVEWLYNTSKVRELDIFDLQTAKSKHKSEWIDAFECGEEYPMCKLNCPPEELYDSIFEDS
jgi:hypothetical protein